MTRCVIGVCLCGQHAGAASRLSAEAQSFVPGQARQLQADGGNITDNELSQLPRYITSCYPFVKEEQGHGQRSVSMLRIHYTEPHII